jgi:hypothetical protein
MTTRRYRKARSESRTPDPFLPAPRLVTRSNASKRSGAMSDSEIRWRQYLSEQPNFLRQGSNRCSPHTGRGMALTHTKEHLLRRYATGDLPWNRRRLSAAVGPATG